MKSSALTPDEYMEALPEERIDALKSLREIFQRCLPDFDEVISYGMITYVVPLNIYPEGYHCTPGQALPFISIASQKNFIAVYHMGIYANEELLNWFVSEYQKYTGKKPDMGKSCIRFKKPEQIPFKLIEELAGKISMKEWIKTYETVFKK